MNLLLSAKGIIPSTVRTRGIVVHQFRGIGRKVMIIVPLATACTAQLVAPYNADLQQRASSMQAEVASWDLAMRHGAGTIADDPRNPDVIAQLNKWRGDADAMLTLAISSDPQTVTAMP